MLGVGVEPTRVDCKAAHGDFSASSRASGWTFMEQVQPSYEASEHDSNAQMCAPACSDAAGAALLTVVLSARSAFMECLSARSLAAHDWL